MKVERTQAAVARQPSRGMVGETAGRLETFEGGRTPLEKGRTPELSDPKVFEAETGFPDLAEVSRRMLDNVRNALQQAQSDTGIEILYAGYDQHCSVGKGDALPASDIDFLHILVREPSDREKFFSRFQSHIDPALVGLEQKKPEHCMLSLDDLQRPGDSFLLTMLGRSLYSQGGTLIPAPSEWRATLHELVPRPEPTLTEKAMPLMPPKAKYVARKQLVEAYPSLSTAEKRLVWRVIHSNPDDDDMHFLDLVDGNPNRPVLDSLAAKGVLLKMDPTDGALRDVVSKWRDIFATWPADNRDGWFRELDRLMASPPRLIAAWRPSHTDDPIMTDLYFPDIEPARRAARASIES